MSASQNLSQSQFGTLYHGTVHPFQPGDIVTPAEAHSKAWATENINVAKERAKDWVGYSWNSREDQGPDYTWEKHQELVKPKVFEVEPVNPGEVTPTEYQPGSFTSKAGFRVVRQVH